MEKDNSSKLTLTALILLGMTVLTIATLFVPTMVAESINTEVQYMATMVGHEHAEQMYTTASYMTNTVLYESGVIETVRNTLLPKSYLEGSEFVSGKETFIDGLWQPLDNAIQAVAMNVDLLLLRIQMLKIWLAAFVVLLVASFLSGYWIREIKKHGFEYSSPMRHGLSRRVIYIMPFLCFLYLIAPFAIPTVLLPFLLLQLCLAVMMLVANTIKRV